MAPQLRNGEDEVGMVSPVRRKTRGRQRAIRRDTGQGGQVPNKLAWTAEQKSYMTAGYQFAAQIAKIHGLVLPTELPFTRT
jgi:hypothetical protein